MPKFIVTPNPFQRSKKSTLKIMLLLTAALGLIWAFAIAYNFTIAWQYGLKAILMVIVAVAVSFISDILVFSLKYKNDQGAFFPYLGKKLSGDFSWVTGIIFALTLPIGTPYYVIIMGALFSTLIVKHVFGGFGHNIFNPAAFGRIFVLLSFGSSLTTTLNIPGVTDQSLLSGVTITTAYSNALSGFKWMGSSLPNLNIWNIWLGNYTAALGEAFTLAILLIGIVLIVLEVINWRIPVFYLGTVALTSVVIALISGLNVGEYVLLQLGLGGLAFGAVFMLTDPVTSPTSPYGKALIGVVAGLLTVLIRIQGNYPEGVVFAIALTNVLTPLIDRFTVGMTNYKVWKKWVTVSALLFVSIGVSGGIAGGRVLGQNGSSSSSSSTPPPIEIRTVLHGQATSRVPAYDPNYDFTIELDVHLSKEFDIVKIELSGDEVSPNGHWPVDWNANLETLLDTYTIYSVEDILALENTLDEPPLNTTGVTISSNRVLAALKDAFKDVNIYKGYAITSIDEDDDLFNLTANGFLNGLRNDVIVYTVNDIISGLKFSGKVTTGGNYQKLYDRGVEAMYNYYLSHSVSDLLATSPYPSESHISGSTITTMRLYDAIIDALNKGPLLPENALENIVLKGSATSKVPAFDADHDFTIQAEVTLTKQFHILSIKLTGEEVSQNGPWPTKWNAGVASLLETYTIFTPEEILGLSDSKDQEGMNISTVSISSLRVLNAVKDAFKDLTIVTGSAITDINDPLYGSGWYSKLDGHQTDVTVYVIDNKVAGFRLSNKITTGGNYEVTFNNGESGLYQYYVGKTVSELLATSPYPIDSNITGVSASSQRIYAAIIDALSKI